MKKTLSIFTSAALAVSMLGGVSAYAEDTSESITADFYTYDQLLEMEPVQIQKIYDEEIGSPSIDFLEKDCTQEKQLDEFCLAAYGTSYESLFNSGKRYLTYSVDLMHSPDENLGAEAFGLPADWSVTADKGKVADAGFNYGKSYIQGNSYYVDVPDEVLKSHWNFVRLWLQQELFERSEECSKLSIKSVDPVLDMSFGMPAPMRMGDADGKYDEITITDAVTIMSFCTNSAKYPMDVYCQRAADVYNNGDGINNMDALAIQKYLVGTITELPESYMGDINNVNEKGMLTVTVTDQGGNPVKGAEIEISSSPYSISGEPLPTPDVYIEPLVITTDENGKAEVSLTKFYTEGAYFKYTASLGTLPEGYRLGSNYSPYDFNFLSGNSCAVKYTVINENLADYNKSDYSLKVEIASGPDRTQYDQFSRELNTSGLTLNVWKIFSDGSEEQIYENTPVSEIENITIGDIDTESEGEQSIPVTVKSYNETLEQWVSGSVSFDIEYYMLVPSVTETYPRPQSTTSALATNTTTTTVTTAMDHNCTTTKEYDPYEITVVADTIESISDNGISFQETYNGKTLSFSSETAEYFKRYYAGDKIYLKCMINKSDFSIAEIMELRGVFENSDKILEVNLYCFDEEYSHEEASVMLKVSCDVECTNDVVHPEQKVFYLKAGKGTTKLAGLPAVSSMCGNKCVYTVEVIDTGNHYVSSESKLIDIDDNNMRKNLYVRYLTDEDKKNLKDIDFGFTSNISEVTDNTVTFANGETLKGVSEYFGNFSIGDEIYVSGIKKEGYGDKVFRLDNVLRHDEWLSSYDMDWRAEISLNCNTHSDDDILAEIYREESVSTGGEETAPNVDKGVCGYVRVNQKAPVTVNLAGITAAGNPYNYTLRIAEDNSFHVLKDGQVCFNFTESDKVKAELNVYYCPPPADDGSSDLAETLNSYDKLSKSDNVTFSGNQALVKFDVMVQTSGCVIGNDDMEWSVSGTADAEIATNLLSKSVSYTENYAVSGCLITANSPGTVILKGVEKHAFNGNELATVYFSLNVDEDGNFDGTYTAY